MKIPAPVPPVLLYCAVYAKASLLSSGRINVLKKGGGSGGGGS